MKKNLLYTLVFIFSIQFGALYAQCDEGVKTFVSDNLVQNGSFEAGNTGFQTEQSYFGDCSSNLFNQTTETYAIVFSGGTPSDCNSFWTPNISATDGDRIFVSNFPANRNNVDLWCQTLNVTPDSDYEFSANFANAVNEIYSAPDPSLRIMARGDNSNLGQILRTQDQFRLSEGGGWQNAVAEFNSKDNTEIEICIQNINRGFNGNDFAMDNLIVRQFECVIEEEEKEEIIVQNRPEFYDCDEIIDNTPASVLNGGFEDGSFNLSVSTVVNVDITQMDNWSTSSLLGNINIMASGNDGVSAYEGNVYVDIDNLDSGDIYQDITTAPGDVILFSFAHRGRTGVNMVGIYMDDPNVPYANHKLVNTYSTDDDRWIMYQGKYEVPADQTTTRFSIRAITISSGILGSVTNVLDGSLIDAVTVQSSKATCENPKQGNIEICANGLDDDNDGLIDDADPDCSTTGGNDGGLESNGRLAEKIFNRTLDRRIDPTTAKRNKVDMLQKERTATYGVFGEVNQRSILSIEEFIPIDTLSNTNTFISSPTDLENITNATEVFSVDIFREDVRLAAIFATATQNGVYEHTKYICDRLKGGIINDLRTERIGYSDFIIADIYQPEGNREYAMSFSVREDKNGDFDIQSHWSLENYPKEEAYYNFQIWTANMDDLKTLALKTMQLLHEYKSISTMTTTAPPSMFVSQGEYANGKLNMKIINKSKSTNISLIGEKTATETKNKEAIETSTNISGGYSEFVSIEVGAVYDMGFRIKHDNDTVFDDLFIADGLWFIDTKEGNVQYNVEPNFAEADENVYPLERAIKVEGNIESTLNIYRSMKPNFRAIDVSDYNTLHFNVSGAQAMQIVLIKKSVNEWGNQYKTSITTTGASNEINIPLSRFDNGSGVTIKLDDIQAIIFKIEGQETSKNINIDISSLDFRNEKDALVENAFEDSKVIITPNPSTNNVNVQWKSQDEGMHRAVLMDSNGRVISEFVGLTSRGHNQIMIERNNLSAGIYFFAITEQSGKIISDKIVFMN